MMAQTGLILAAGIASVMGEPPTLGQLLNEHSVFAARSIVQAVVAGDTSLGDRNRREADCTLADLMSLMSIAAPLEQYCSAGSVSHQRFGSGADSEDDDDLPEVFGAACATSLNMSWPDEEKCIYSALKVLDAVEVLGCDINVQIFEPTIQGACIPASINGDNSTCTDYQSSSMCLQHGCTWLPASQLTVTHGELVAVSQLKTAACTPVVDNGTTTTCWEAFESVGTTSDPCNSTNVSKSTINAECQRLGQVAGCFDRIFGAMSTLDEALAIFLRQKLNLTANIQLFNHQVGCINTMCSDTQHPIPSGGIATVNPYTGAPLEPTGGPNPDPTGGKKKSVPVAMIAGIVGAVVVVVIIVGTLRVRNMASRSNVVAYSAVNSQPSHLDDNYDDEGMLTIPQQNPIAVQMYFCPNCGQADERGDATCKSCGTRIR